MKKTKELNEKMRVEAHDYTQKGITLIALVITIIVMLILVAVTISMAVNGGLFDYAGKAISETNNALKAEQDLANGGIKVGDTWYNSIDEYLEASNREYISKTESYVGCYADVDGDGTVDGVIYADLAFSSEENASWTYGYSYTATPAEELKDYCLSGTYDGDFNEEGKPKEVIKATGTGGEKDRFYVMALEDFTEEGNVYYWYYNAYDNEKTEVVTVDGFGTGKANTVTMIEKWNASAFGTQNGDAYHKDIWGSIQILASKGWFVPSAGEWDAFADAFNVYTEWDDDGYHTITSGLSDEYWSSSQRDSVYIWSATFINDRLGGIGPAERIRVRLSATF